MVIYLKIITSYVALFGLATAETGILLADLNAIRYTNLLVKAVAKFALACTKYRNAMNSGLEEVPTPAFPVFVPPPLPPTAVQPGVYNRIRKFVKILKANANYTDVIGLDLATIGATIVVNYALYKPVLKLSLNGLALIIKYTKKGTGGIQLYCMRGAETEFTLLATISKASYSDLRANLIAGQPETRNYQAWYVVNDVVVGLISAVSTISIGG
jgi:hypothetical protein